MITEPVVHFVDTRNVSLEDRWGVDTAAGHLDCLPGAESDGASIPEVLWSIPGFCAFEGDTLPAAFAHDQLYAGELCARDVADGVLYDLLRANGVGWLRAKTYYLAVRAFGGLVWKQHTPDSIANARKYATLSPIR